MNKLIEEEKALINKKRIEYLDIAKGIGIILMIIGHAGIRNKYITSFIYSFHMPLFFIISGYFFKYRDNKECLKRNFKKLIIPYIITCLTLITYKVLRLILDGEFTEIMGIIKKWGLASLYGSGAAQPFGIRFIGAIWFLLALFFALYFINITSKSKYQYLWIMVIAYIGYKTSRFIWLPLSIQAGMVATIFVYLGILARKNDVFNKKIPMQLMIFAILIVIFCTIYCGPVGMVSNNYKNGFLDIIGALCGTFICIKISQIIERKTKILKKILVFIGENSLICLCLHLFALNCIYFRTIYSIMKNIGIDISTVRSIIAHMLWVFITLPITKFIIEIVKKINLKLFKKTENNI